MAAQAQIVDALVHNDAAGQHAARAGQREHRIAERRLCHTVLVGLQVTQVADVAHLAVAGAVRDLHQWPPTTQVSPGEQYNARGPTNTHLVRIVVRSQAGAVLRQISLLVHMEAELAVRGQTGHVHGQQHRLTAALLHERDVATHRAAAGQHGDGLDWLLLLLLDATNRDATVMQQHPNAPSCPTGRTTLTSHITPETSRSAANNALLVNVNDIILECLLDCDEHNEIVSAEARADPTTIAERLNCADDVWGRCGLAFTYMCI